MLKRSLVSVAVSFFALSLLPGGSVPAQAHSKKTSTLCQQVRAWSGEGCTSQNTRAFWKATSKRRADASRSSRSGRSSVPATLRRVAGCESGSGPNSAPNYRAENPRSTASGAYQFVNGTWTSITGLRPPASAHAPAVQDRAAAELWDGGRGAHHWNASRHCWG